MSSSALSGAQFSFPEHGETGKFHYRSPKNPRKTVVREATHDKRGMKGGKWQSKSALKGNPGKAVKK